MERETIMFEKVTPEQAGVPSAAVERFYGKLDEYNFAMHSVLMAKGDKIFTEGYYKPFHKDYLHRMNSVTKSFVALAIGYLIEEGKISLQDKLIKYFKDELPEKIHPNLYDFTIYDALTMRTAAVPVGGHWVRDKKYQRIKEYFKKKQQRPPGTIFSYDSSASYLLGVLVERLTGQGFIEYLYEKLLKKLGFLKEVTCIKTPEGYSWSDSGLLCTPRNLYATMLFIKNKGIWNGERLMNEQFLVDAVKKHTDCSANLWGGSMKYGYGYQIWKVKYDGFAFLGMGDQIAVCFPKKDFFFVCTADNQGNESARALIFDFLSDVYEAMGDTPLPENPEGAKRLAEITDNLELLHLKGDKHSDFEKELDGVVYALDENPMNISEIMFRFRGDEGLMFYKNKQGEKELLFGLGKNVFTDFPKYDYPDDIIGVPKKGNRFPCAVSAAWVEEKKLMIKVMMIGKHLGGLLIQASFKDDVIGISMVKNTNCFLYEYDGYAGGKIKK